MRIIIAMIAFSIAFGALAAPKLKRPSPITNYLLDNKGGYLLDRVGGRLIAK